MSTQNSLKLLLAVEAAIDALLNKRECVTSYTIKGRTLERCSLAELQALRTELKRECAAKRRSRVQYRFCNPR